MNNLTLTLLASAALATTGCPDVDAACESYRAASNSCLTDQGEATGADFSATMLGDDFCADNYGGVTDQETADRLLCLAGEFDRIDCFVANAWTAVDVSSCTSNEEE